MDTVPGHPTFLDVSLGVPSIGNTLGAILIGTFVTLMLYGLTVHQTYRYVCLYPNDPLLLKVMALGLFTMDTLHCGALIHLCYHYLVTNYFNPSASLENVWSMQSMPTVTGLIVLLAQSFYLRRIYIGMANKLHRIMIAIIAILMAFETGIVIVEGITAFKSKTYEDVLRYLWLDSMLLCVAIVIDLSLTGALVAILRTRRTEFEHTNGVLDTLALYAVIATVVNTVLTVPAFAFSLAEPHNYVWIAIAMPVTKVYTNCVLAMLNCRVSLHKGERRATKMCGTDASVAFSVPRASVLPASGQQTPFPPSASDTLVVSVGADEDPGFDALLRLLEEGLRLTVLAQETLGSETPDSEESSSRTCCP
ncbi:hypothetical protein C8Q80DRAFT_194979 [Daedaleopsis nitida]|nr:hypothetical protein C8Q80DRAFT_194979 [Daedaleopsis nitida]